MRILVTNDDGIDSVGLHVLARAMVRHGDVVVGAPDREYSGAGAALGALHLIQPEVRHANIEGVETAWAVNGPPGLCVMFSRLGVFGPPFDLVVAGINPGANVGRAVYHSGTVGACLTARNGGVSGVAVSQAVTGFGIEGQGWDDMIKDQKWEAAAEVADVVVGGLIASPPDKPVVVNVNVPNMPVAEMQGWRHSDIGTVPPRSMAGATLVPMTGHDGAYTVQMNWGEALELPVDTDGGAVEAGYVSVTCLSRIKHEPRDDLAGAWGALDGALGPRR
jgi:5'-nucleotidase